MHEHADRIGGPTRFAEVRVAEIAERQRGRIARRQLRALGLGEATISAWLRRGRLHRVLPGVYALGHRAGGVEGDLAAALLDAGPGAALGHTTGAWCRGLSDGRPR